MHLCKPSKLSIRGVDESTANDDTEDCEDEKDTTHCFTCGGTYVMKRKTSEWDVITVTDGITIDVQVLQHYHPIYSWLIIV